MDGWLGGWVVGWLGGWLQTCLLASLLANKLAWRCVSWCVTKQSNLLFSHFVVLLCSFDVKKEFHEQQIGANSIQS